MKPAVITGVGMVTPYGVDIKTNWSKLLKNETCIQKMKAFEDIEFEDVMSMTISDDIDLSKYLPLTDDVKNLCKSDMINLLSTYLAFKSWGIDLKELEKEYISFIIGTGNSIKGYYSNAFRKILRQEELDPNSLKNTIFFNPVDFLAEYYSTSDEKVFINNGFTSGLDAIGYGFAETNWNEKTSFVVSSYETLNPEFILSCFNNNLLSTEDSKDQPKPFDPEGAGWVLAEGSATLLVESPQKALSKKRKNLAWIHAFKKYFLPEFPLNLQKNVKQLEEFLSDFFEEARTLPSKIDLIISSASGLPILDRIEGVALNTFFNNKIPILPLKGHFGECGAAFGTIATIMGMLILHSGQIPAIKNTKNFMEDLDLNFVKEPIAKEVKTILLMNLSFSGQVSMLLLKKDK